MESITSKWGIESLRLQNNSMAKLALQIRFFLNLDTNKKLKLALPKLIKKQNKFTLCPSLTFCEESFRNILILPLQRKCLKKKERPKSKAAIILVANKQMSAKIP